MATELERPTGPVHGNWLHEGQILDPVMGYGSVL